jgi:hypothetical protein
VAFSQEAAETIAVQALAWLASTDDLLHSFMGASGLAPEDLRAQAGDPALAGAVLDFILMDDAWVVGFCDTIRLAYADLALVRASLPGGAQMHWT